MQNTTIMTVMAVEINLKAAQRKITSAHDQALLTKYHATKILHTATGSKCVLCQQYEEKMCHLISACPVLSKYSI